MQNRLDGALEQIQALAQVLDGGLGNGGTIFRVGYVPVEAIQQEGRTVNQNIAIVVASLMAAIKIWLILVSSPTRYSWWMPDTSRWNSCPVEDNGYGMTPEYLETIFDAFTRAENSTTNKVQGTGLGMAITTSPRSTALPALPAARRQKRAL